MDNVQKHNICSINRLSLWEPYETQTHSVASMPSFAVLKQVVHAVTAGFKGLINF
jgi:hypothetical protein